MFSTSVDVQYIEGVQYFGDTISKGGCSVHLGDTLSTSGIDEYIGRYHEYIGDVQYIGGYHDSCGGYYEYIRGCSVHRGFQYKSKPLINLLPHMNLDILPMH